jgi:hypothetical protein
MILTFSSPKPGTGVTVTAALAAITASTTRHVTIVDLAGDQLSALGVTAVGHRQIEVTDRITVIDATTDPHDEQHRAITDASQRDDLVIVDAGAADHPVHDLLPDARRVWVIRACYLTLRRAVATIHRPDEIVLIREPGRALTDRDIEHTLGSTVTAVIDVDPAIARAVDAGLLTARAPRITTAALGPLIESAVEVVA